MFNRIREATGVTAPCTPHRLMASAEGRQLNNVVVEMAQEMQRRDDIADALHTELERSKETVTGLRIELQHRTALAATIERELDGVRTENDMLSQQIEDMERDAYEYRCEIQRLRDELAATRRQAPAPSVPRPAQPTTPKRPLQWVVAEEVPIEQPRN